MLQGNYQCDCHTACLLLQQEPLGQMKMHGLNSIVGCTGVRHFYPASSKLLITAQL